MAKTSAGILMFRRRGDGIEVLLVHPGGPFWAKKDEGAWSIPKGEYEDGEDAFSAATREFEEETGVAVDGEFTELTQLKQPSGKRVSAWALEGECDATSMRSNTFTMEWPPKSGRQAEFPEVDRAAWFGLATARRKLHRGQVPFIDELCLALGVDVSRIEEAADDSLGGDPGAQASLF